MSDLKVRLLLEAIDRLTSPLRRMTEAFVRGMGRMRESLRDLGKGMTDFGKGFSLKISAPISAFGVLAVRQSAKFETLFAALKRVSGGMDEANAKWDELVKFATTTPFQLDEVVSAFVRLKNIGLDPSMDALTAYGNIAASVPNKTIMDFIEAVADATVGEMERLKEFGIRASQQGKKVAFTFAGVTTVVKNNAADIQRYLQGLGLKEFGGGMDVLADTMNGTFSNFTDVVGNSMAAAGRAISKQLNLRDFVIKLADAITNLTDAFLKLPEPLQKFIVYGGLILSLLGPLIIGFGQFALGLSFTILGFSKLAPLFGLLATITTRLLIPSLLMLARTIVSVGVALLTTPVGWFLLAAAAIAGAAYLVIRNWDKVSAFFNQLWEGIKSTFRSAVDAIMDWLQPLFDAIDALQAGLEKVKSFATDNAVTSAVGDWFGSEKGKAPEAFPFGAPVDLSGGAPVRNSLDAGGQIHIRIDSDGQPRVLNARPNDGRVGYSVDTGLLMGGL